MSKLYSYEDLKYKSQYDLYQICKNERLVEGVLVGKINKNELINLILKYRGEKPKYTIEEVNEFGLAYIQDLFDNRLNVRLHDNNIIKIPNKITLYDDLNMRADDKYAVNLPDGINNRNIFLVNENNYLCGIFGLEKDRKHKDKFYLTSLKEHLRLEGLQNENFSFVFFKEIDSKYLYDFYYGRTDKYPHSLDYFKIKINHFELRKLEDTRATLCIDFGSTNTVAGAYLDPFYISELPQNDIQNGNIKMEEVNYVMFPLGEDTNEKTEQYPTIMYVEDCSGDEAKYLFGHEVNNKMKEKNYILKGSILYKLKSWIHDLNVDEKVIDVFGNIKYIPRKEILRAFFNFLIEKSKYQFKCNFRNLHIITPVKLKEEYLNLFTSILPDYNILQKNVLDEGISVMYNTIEKHMKNNRFENGEEYKAFIIDCGGSTTELATCNFSITKSEICYTLDISTSFEDGEENFGGNNITYRIMQYLKIALVHYYMNTENFSLESYIPFCDEEIFRHIDQNGVESIYEIFDKEYSNAEGVIPTKFGEFENKSSLEYKKIKNNFFFLWDIAEKLKEFFFTENNIIQVKFDYDGFIPSSNISVLPLPTWKLNILENGNFKEINVFPSKVFDVFEIKKLIKGDIYEVIRKFMLPYFESGEIFDFSIIKLSGQSCKIPIFNEVLKEFVPGKYIDFKVKNNSNPYELKLSSLNGAIAYLNSARFGDVRVNMINEIATIPVSVKSVKYTGEEVTVLRLGNEMDKNKGYVIKSSSAIEVSFKLYSAEGEFKKEYLYTNTADDFETRTAEEIIEEFGNKINQRDLDTIEDFTSKFFVYTNTDSWGFYVWVVKREEENLYLGKRKYFPFDNKSNIVSFFNGNY